MRNMKTFEIKGYDKKFTVYELKIKQIISLIAGDMLEDTSLEGLKSNFSETLLPMCSDITFGDLEEMAPSEIKEIWNQFKEVNDSFFELAQKMGLQEILETLKKSIIEDFGKIVVPSSSQDIQAS